MRKQWKQKGEASFNALLCSYKKNAYNFNRIFDLTKEQFKKLTSDNCFYCGKEPEREYKNAKITKFYGTYLYNGIDRIDNNIGYIFSNCITCCFECNKMKGTMNFDDFINQIKRIASNIEDKE